MILPAGFTVRLDRRVRVIGDEYMPVAGATVVRLTVPLRSGFIRVDDPASAAVADRLVALGLAHPVTATLPGPPPGEVTYVVPVRDRPAALSRLLASIGTRARVIVVDDASLDPGPLAAAAAEHGAVYVRLTENVGPAAARNAGLAMVDTEFVCFVDSDVVLPRGGIELLLRHFTDPSVTLVAPRVGGLPAPGWIGAYEQVRSSLDLGSDPALVRPRSSVGWVPSACLLARTRDLATGFAEELRVAEDVDLVWRLARSGRRIRYDPSVVVHHECRATARDWFRRKVFYGTGADPLARRHGSAVAPAVFAPWSAMLVAAVLAQRRWSLLIGVAATMAAAVRVHREVAHLDEPLLVPRLMATGIATAFGQTRVLLVRHWWPVTAMACLCSRNARRAAVVAISVDTAIQWRRGKSQLGPMQFAAVRRIDDAAYGAGLWLGAIRGRSARALIPTIQGSRQQQ